MFFVLNLRKFLKILKYITFVLIIAFLIKIFISYIFPVEYENIIDKYSKQYNLEKSLVYSVINAESRFDEKALSNKGAMGLMQIMPDTGIWLAEKANIKNITEENIKYPEININLGCFYIRYLLDKYQDEKLALCAYNAGTTNVYKWLQDERYSLDGELHTIPFKETERYVKKINLFKKGYDIILKVKELFSI